MLLLFLLHLIYFYPGAFNQIKLPVFNVVVPICKSTLQQLLSSGQPLAITNNNIHNFTLFKRSLKVLQWVLVLSEQKGLNLEKKEQIQFVVERVKQGCEDRSLIHAAKEISRYII